MPTLLIAGEHDRNAPPAVMKKMADAIPHSTYLEMKGIGHLQNLEAPDDFDGAAAELPGAAAGTAALNADEDLHGRLPALDFTPAVGDHAFTPKQRSLLALAHQLGRDKFAARAAQWDEEASFPFANYEDLRAPACWGSACRKATAASAPTTPPT